MASTVETSSKTFSLRWKRLVFIVIVVSLVAPFMAAVIRDLQMLDDRNIPCCDYAVLDLNTSAFLDGEQFTGPYSRQGWYHPGPLGIGWYSIFRILPGDSFAQYQIAAITLAVLALGFFLWQLRKHPLVVVALSSAVLLFWSTRFDWVYFLDPWNPIGAMFWVLTFLAATITAITTLKRSFVVVSAILGGIAIQTHIGSAPTVLFSFVVLAIVFWRRRAPQEFLRDAIWFVGTSFLVWLLPIWDFFFRTHNFLRIFTENDTPVNTTSQFGIILKNTVQMLVLSPSPQGKWLGQASVFFPSRSLTIGQVFFFVVLMGLCINVFRQRKNYQFEFLAIVLGLSSTLLTIMFLLISRSDYAPYVLLPIVGIGPLLWISCLSVLIQDAFRNRKIVMIDARSRLQKGLIVLSLILTLVFSGLAVRQIPSARSETIFATPAEQERNEAILSRCSEFAEGERVVFTDEFDWDQAVQIFAQLNLCADMTTYGDYAFIIGDAYREDPDNELTVLVARAKSEIPAGWPIAVDTPQLVIAKTPRP